MVSVIIAAHDEEYVIGATLDALLDQSGVRASDVVVSANGCRDETAAIARQRNVVVLDIPEAGKAAALNAADDVATGYPRVYLDGDIVLPRDAIGRLIAHFDEAPAAMAVVPRRKIDASASTWPVRAYFAINEQLPVFRTGLFGRGVIVLSRAGRDRFDTFPAMVADDLYIDAQFTLSERVEAPEVEIVVVAPQTTRSLVARLSRVRRGNTQMRSAAAEGSIVGQVRASDRWSWLRDVVLPQPRLFLAAGPYVAITLLASIRRRRTTNDTWDQDRTTRNAPPVTQGPEGM